MSVEADPFIITENKRSLELTDIRIFLKILKDPLKQMIIDKMGDIEQYISFDHFLIVNNIQSDKFVTSCGYIFGNQGIIYLPSRSTSDDDESRRVTKIIATMHESGVRNWILDYRGNTGGRVLTFMMYISPFITKPFILNEQNGRAIIEFKKDNISIFGTYWAERPYCPRLNIDSIRVIVNGVSGSSSEFSAHILKTHGAIIHGTRTASAFTTVSSIRVNGGLVLFPKYKVSDDEHITPDTDEVILLK